MKKPGNFGPGFFVASDLPALTQVVESEQDYRSQGDKCYKHDDSSTLVPWPQH